MKFLVAFIWILHRNIVIESRWKPQSWTERSLVLFSVVHTHMLFRVEQSSMLYFLFQAIIQEMHDKSVSPFSNSTSDRYQQTYHRFLWAAKEERCSVMRILNTKCNKRVVDDCHFNIKHTHACKSNKNMY